MSHAPPARRKDCKHNGDSGSGGNRNLNNSTDDDDDEILNQLPIPPDGGWGWMVAFASFMIHIVTDGITYSFGMFYVEFCDYFGEGKGYTAWIASILVGVTLCSGPISSSFVNRYGCRAVTIAGAVLAAVCMLLSMFAQNVLTLIFTIGIGTGFGFGLIYLPAIVSVTMYFEKYRSLATGIAVCGSGLGTFIFAPLTELLIGTFEWRGALVVLAGIVLNCIIFGAMFRPLPTPQQQQQQLRKQSNSNNIDENHIDDNDGPLTIKNRKNLEHSKENELQPLRINSKNNLELPKKFDMAAMGRSQSIGYGMGVNSQTRSGHTNSNRNIGPNKPLMRVTVSQPHINVDGDHQHHPVRAHRDSMGSGTMYRPDILYQGSLLNIAEYRSRSDSLNAGTSEIKRYGSLIVRDKSYGEAENGDETKINHLCGCIPCSKETSDTFNEMMDFSLFRDVIFIVFTLSNFCTSVGFNIPYVYLAAQAETLNLTKKEASFLLSIIGIANTVGRIVLGYLADKPWVNRLLVYNVCLTICGISTALSIYCDSFLGLAIYSSVFGFTIGAYVGLTSVILVDLLGLAKLTNAFGLLLLFQGIASLVGPPFAGWLFDVLGSYNPGFLLSGSTIAISGIMLFSIPLIQKYKFKKHNEMGTLNNGKGREISIS